VHLLRAGNPIAPVGRRSRSWSSASTGRAPAWCQPARTRRSRRHAGGSRNRQPWNLSWKKAAWHDVAPP
jgi:hypothetical protein